MTWRLAKSLAMLREQIDAVAPNRSTASDGTIGDGAHSSRASDHNPHIKDGAYGVVSALDITNDLAHGVDAGALAEFLRQSKDRRIKYIISNGRIASSQDDWAWRPYTGLNPHTKHVHISVKADKPSYDSIEPWAIGLAPSDEQTTEPQAIIDPILRKGHKGSHVGRLQELLNKRGAALDVDGDFGLKTEDAVKVFQKKYGLVADGVVGAYTWSALK